MGPTLMTWFKLNYFLTPNTVTLEARTSTYKLEGNTIQSLAQKALSLDESYHSLSPFLHQTGKLCYKKKVTQVNRLISLEIHDHKSQRAHSNTPMSGNPIVLLQQIHFSIPQNNFHPKLHIPCLPPHPPLTLSGWLCLKCQ